MSGAFQKNAFQNNAFQVDAGASGGVMPPQPPAEMRKKVEDRDFWDIVKLWLLLRIKGFTD